ncbi:MAG: hypothetical protein LBQ43_00370 [Holosporales bacterium]|nr:hypothetical protein [Holosporales bacterium]
MVKRAQTLYGRLGMGTEAKMAFLSAWGVEHTNHLNVKQLIDACNTLDTELNPQLAQMDKQRKRVMGVIGSWARATGNNNSAAYIKAIACHAANKNSFNDIPLATLRHLYAEFNNRLKIRNAVAQLDEDSLLLNLCKN